MLKAFILLEIFYDYDIIVTIDMPSLGYYPALGLYSAGQSSSQNMTSTSETLPKLFKRACLALKNSGDLGYR